MYTAASRVSSAGNFRALHALGLHMGERMTANYEDPVMVSHIANFRKSHDPNELEPVKAMLKERGKQHRFWGWKIPGQLMPELYDVCPNPRFISIHRDAVAITSRIAASDNKPIMGMFQGIQELQDSLLNFLTVTPHPAFMISYEKALLYPQTFVDGLIHFLKPYQPSEQQRADAIAAISPSPKDYLMGTRTPETEGNFDGFEAGHLMGWARSNHDQKKALTITITIDNDFTATTTNDQYRADVEKIKGGNGHCGFAYKVPDALLDGKMHHVSITIPGEPDVLVGSSEQELVLTA